MKRALSLCVLGLLLALAVTAYADIARPKESPKPAPTTELPKIVLHTGLTIVPDNKAWEAKLQISQSSLQELRAALANVPENESMAQRLTRSSTQTIVAGLFMFLSLSFAGVWLARSAQSRGRKTMAALLIGSVAIAAAAVIVKANAGPPGSYYWKKLPQNLSQNKSTSGGVDIEIIPDPADGSRMTLILPIKP
jgi:hypothetical protein